MPDLLTVDTLAAVAWVTTNLLLLAAGWRVSRRVASQDTPAALLLHTAVFYWGVIVGSATLLGALGMLTAVSLLGTVAALALLTLWWVPANLGANVATDRADRYGLIGWGGLMAFWVGYVVSGGLLEFPTDWDSLMYHIPLVDQWLCARSLYAPDDAVWYNPGNNELIGLWLVAPFSGDFLIGLNNLPALILLSLGSVEVGRQAGLSPLYAWMGGLAVVANGIVSWQLLDSENDVAVAALFVASLAYGFRYARSGQGGDLALGAMGVGLLAGVKYYALGYGVVAGVTLVLATALARGLRSVPRAAAFTLLGALVWGGYWYLRNTWVTGLPLYPKGYSAETDLIVEEWRSRIWTSTFLGSGRAEVWPLVLEAVKKMTGPCHLVATVAIPVTVGWLLVSGLWRRWFDPPRTEASIRVAVAVALMGSALVWGMTPYAAETTPGTLDQLRDGYLPVRFGLSFLSLAVIGLVRVLEDVGQGLRAFAMRLTGSPGSDDGVWLRTLGLLPALLFGVASAYQFCLRATYESKSHYLIDSLLIGFHLMIVVALAYVCWTRWPESQRRLTAGGAALLMAVVVVAANGLADRWHAGFTPFYDRMFAGDTFSTLAQRDPATTRMCVLTARYYPFFGSYRQYRVSRPTRVPSYVAFRDYLRARDVNVVVIGGDQFARGRYRHGVDRIIERPSLFRQVRQGSSFVVYEVDSARLGEEVGLLPQPTAQWTEPCGGGPFLPAVIRTVLPVDSQAVAAAKD